MVRARKDRNTPFPASWAKNDAPGPSPSPPPPPCGIDIRSPTPRITGSTTSTPSRARLRQRRNIRRSSLPSRRSQARTPLRGRGRPASAAAPALAGAPSRGADSSAVDIESLPGQSDEQFLEARPRRVQACYRDAGVDQLTADQLRGLVGERRGRLPAGGGHVGQPQLAQDLRGPGDVGRGDPDPGYAAGPQLFQRSLEDQP